MKEYITYIIENELVINVEYLSIKTHCVAPAISGFLPELMSGREGQLLEKRFTFRKNS